MDAPGPGDSPEAEWGFEPALREDVCRFAARHGFRVRRLVYDDPEAPSPGVADLYRWWYGRRGLPTTRLLVESFVLCDPCWALRTACVPYWTTFSVTGSLRRLAGYLDRTAPFDLVAAMPFPHGVASVGLAGTADWAPLLARARVAGRFVAVSRTGSPPTSRPCSPYAGPCAPCPGGSRCPSRCPRRRSSRSCPRTGRGSVGGVRVAVVGKGGTGKSVLVGTLARLLGRAGEPVLVVDSDPMPGLALSLGVPAGDAGLPGDLVVPDGDGAGRRVRWRAGVAAADVVARYAVPGPDGVRLVQLGKFRGRPGEHDRSHAVFQRLLDELPPGWRVVGDLPGGTRQPFFGWARYARLVLVVTEPTAASMLSARRLARLAGPSGGPRMVAVAAKVRAPGDAAAVAAGTGLPVACAVPYDPLVRAAEQAGRAPLDAAGDGPAVQAIASLAAWLRQESEEAGP